MQEEIVAAGASVDMNSSTRQSVYTVPTGMLFIPTRGVFRGSAPGVFNGGETGAMRLYHGDGSMLAQKSVLPATAGVADSALQVIITDGYSIPAGDEIKCRPDNPYGSEQACLVDLFGYLVGV